MRQDRGVSGDAQRLEQLGWLLFLKILDEKDQELELIRDDYVSVIPEKFQWRNWATNQEGITGDELLTFIDHPVDGLFVTLKKLKSTIQILHNIIIFFPFLIKLDKFLTLVYLIYNSYIINIFYVFFYFF